MTRYVEIPVELLTRAQEIIDSYKPKASCKGCKYWDPDYARRCSMGMMSCLHSAGKPYYTEKEKGDK